MAEMGEGNPATNFQKTVGAQNERVKAIKEQSLGFMDKMVGQYANGAVGAEYKRGEGGFVSTQIVSGGASLDQTWRFDQDGKLASVTLQKYLKGRDVGATKLTRDQNGKFQIQEDMVGGDLPKWTEEFYTAKARMAAKGNKPTTTLPPQKLTP